MPLPPLDHDRIAAAFLGALHGFGEGADPDEAFDAAAGSVHTPAAFAAADPGKLQVVATGLSADQAIGHALTWLAEHPNEDTVAAFGILGRSAHTRRTRRLRLEGAELEPDTSPAGRWVSPDGALALALAEHPDFAVEPEELFELVEYKRRARYKPVAQMHKDKSEGQFVALHDGRIVISGQPTAGKARQAAVALLKERGKDDHELLTLEVFKLVGRAGGRSLISVARTRVAQVVSVKIVHATAKETAREPKTAGWLFVTHAS